MNHPTLPLIGWHSLPSLVRLRLDWFNLGMKKTNKKIRDRVGNKYWLNSNFVCLLDIIRLKKI